MADSKQLVPSAQSAMDWVDGKPWSGLRLSRDLLGRALIIYGGLRVAGNDDSAETRKNALAGAMAIELFVIALAALTKGSR